jgi:hypothetical protein
LTFQKARITIFTEDKNLSPLRGGEGTMHPVRKDKEWKFISIRISDELKRKYQIKLLENRSTTQEDIITHINHYIGNTVLEE